ncbi:MAG: TonB-dependent receptor [Porticoccaceae bacterium]
MYCRHLSLAALAAFSATASALDDGTAGDETRIVVTATRSPYSLERVPATVRVISSQDIERSTAANVTELLRSQGALQVFDSMGNGRDASLSLRGFGSGANALVLVDGRKLNNMDLGGPDLSAIPLADVERIEVLEGGAGVLYGDQAVGGVVNIITRGGGKLGGRLSAGRGSYDNENYRASYGGRLDNGLDFRVSGDAERGDGYRRDSNINYDNHGAELGFNYGAGRVFAQAQQTDNERRLTGALFAAQAARDRRQAGASFNDYAADTRVARVGIDHHFGDWLALLASYSDRDEDVVVNATSGFGDSVTLQSRRVRIFDPRLIVTQGPLRLTVGADIERVDYDIALDFGFGFSGSAQEHRKRSEYAQLIYALTDQLDIQAGIRHAGVETDVEPFAVSYDKSVTVQQLGASWRGGDWRVYLNRDETFRFPLADENVDFFGAVNLLDVQRGVAWELGGERQWDDVKVHLALFEHNNHNEIGFDPARGFFGANTNFDDTRRRGGTVDMRWQATRAWDLRALYTYQDARFVDGPYDDNRVPGVSRELAKLSGNYAASSALNLYAELVYTGGQQLDLANSAGGLGGYSVANLAANYRWQAWTLSGRLNNVTAKEYSEFVSFFATKGFFPSPERNIMVTLNYDF